MPEVLCYAACSFGLESIVAQELRTLGVEEIHTRDARVYFTANAQTLARANLCLSAADRVYVVLGEFLARTFDELFEGVKAIRWADWLPKNASFPVSGDAVRSVLKSVPDVQSICKKAVVESLRQSYGLSFYKEDGAAYPIYVSILNDQASVCLNASGVGLNRRGWRVKNAQAPLRETLAAGLIRLTRWRDRPFFDLMCGSGTIAIEAALKARNQAVGLGRGFAAERWSDSLAQAFAEERAAARARITPAQARVFARDIDRRMVEMAQFHARRAGVQDDIVFEQADACAFDPPAEMGAILLNPPYAMRLGERDEVHALYRRLGRRLHALAGYSYYLLSADPDFERHFGRQADKKRKLYNGNVKCCYYQYFIGR